MTDIIVFDLLIIINNKNINCALFLLSVNSQWILFYFYSIAAIFFAAACAQKECPTFCPYDYTPLCTEFENDGVFTFDNKCALDSYNCVHKTSKFIWVIRV